MGDLRKRGAKIGFHVNKYRPSEEGNIQSSVDQLVIEHESFRYKGYLSGFVFVTHVLILLVTIFCLHFNFYSVMNRPLKIFISYAHEDANHCHEIQIYLQPLVNQGLIEVWTDEVIQPGKFWDEEIREALESADLILFVVSKHLLSSENIYKLEMQYARQWIESGEGSVIPVLASDCLWNSTFLGDLQVLPSNGRPIENSFWRGRKSEAYNNIATGILNYCKNSFKLNRSQSRDLRSGLNEVLRSQRKINLRNSHLIAPEPEGQKSKQDQDWSRLHSYNPNLRMLLRANCYDQHDDLDGHMTVQLFRRMLFAATAEINNMREQFKTLIDHPIQNEAKLILMTGFPGNGKTTFIRTFIEETSNLYDHVLYDMDDVMLDRVTDPKQDRQSMIEQAVLEVLHRKMQRDRSEITETFRFILENRDFFEDEKEFTTGFTKKLAAWKDDVETLTYQQVREWMNEMGYKDTFTCFFIHLFLLTEADTRKIIYFDNLDAINIEHIGNRFVKAFGESLWNANSIARSELFAHKDLDFKQKFKFVFCLRDANHEYLIPHIQSRLDLTTRVSFRFSIETTHFREIVERRLEFFKTLRMEEPDDKELLSFERLRQWFDAFLNDDYFTRVFIPLYNHDYRSSVTTLLEVALDSLKTQSADDLQHASSPLRGIMFFHLIHQLKLHDFLSEYILNASMDKNGQIKPYCYLERMVLTVLLNFSQLDDSSDLESAKPVRLTRVLYELEKIYGRRAVLECVAKCFNYHTKDWVQPITILEDAVISEQQFVDRMLALSESEIKKVKIRLNPAGFIYLRYLLPHFEFYSNMANNRRSLYQHQFEKILNKEGDKEIVYDFEMTINRAYWAARVHIEAMEKFFKKNFGNMSPEEYRASLYSFKHLGYGHPHQHGYFHSTRILTAHIGYVDNFRHFALNKKELSPKVDRADINRVLVNKIDLYVELLKNSIDDRAHRNFLEGFTTSIAKIRASQFKDFTTRIQARDL